MTLSKQDFLEVMKFPKEWLAYGMYPNPPATSQVTRMVQNMIEMEHSTGG